MGHLKDLLRKAGSGQKTRVSDSSPILSGVIDQTKKGAGSEFSGREKFAVLESFEVGGIQYKVTSAVRDRKHCRFAVAIKQHIMKYGSCDDIMMDPETMQHMSGSFLSYEESKKSIIIALAK